MQNFEYLGYFKEYWIDNKMIGMLNCEEEKGRVHGYFGRKKEIFDHDITLENKKKIKANTEVQTMIFALCGKQL